MDPSLCEGNGLRLDMSDATKLDGFRCQKWSRLLLASVWVPFAHFAPHRRFSPGFRGDFSRVPFQELAVS